MKLLRNFIIFSLLIPGGIVAQTPLPCPAVNHLTGQRPKLNPEVTEFPKERIGDKAIIENVKQKAIEVVGFFEAGGKSPWSNVNYTDKLSLGFMQWNWGTGSLIDTFIANVSLSDIELAENNVKNDLKILKNYSINKTQENKNKALAVIESWRNNQKRNSLNKWLEIAEIKKIQEKIISKQIEQAFFYARAWNRDSGNNSELNARTVAYFFDLITFNGGTKGIWVSHVRNYRSHFANKQEIVNAISNWLLSCNDFVSTTNTQYKKLYTLNDTTKTANYWKSKISENENAFDDNQINLLVLGLLRAQLSNGNDSPRAFHGVFQADVLNRRGIIAIGGYGRGRTELIELF